jgi:hypothetical protein
VKVQRCATARTPAKAKILHAHRPWLHLDAGSVQLNATPKPRLAVLNVPISEMTIAAFLLVAAELEPSVPEL